MKMIRNLSLIVITLHACYASVIADEYEPNAPGSYQESSNSVEHGNVMTAEEALKMAIDYQVKYIPVECSVAYPEDKGDYWESTVFVGVAGFPGGVIRVEKGTGRVTSDMEPVVDVPGGQIDRP